MHHVLLPLVHNYSCNMWFLVAAFVRSVWPEKDVLDYIETLVVSGWSTAKSSKLQKSGDHWQSKCILFIYMIGLFYRDNWTTWNGWVWSWGKIIFKNAGVVFLFFIGLWLLHYLYCQNRLQENWSIDLFYGGSFFWGCSVSLLIYHTASQGIL